jgi:hypothetical protein
MSQCRCCRKTIADGLLACKEHWFMLPKRLRAAIYETYRSGNPRAHAENVSQADKLWQAAGLWKPGVPS